MPKQNQLEDEISIALIPSQAWSKSNCSSFFREGGRLLSNAYIEDAQRLRSRIEEGGIKGNCDRWVYGYIKAAELLHENNIETIVDAASYLFPNA